MSWRSVFRWLLIAFYAFAGYKHITDPGPFLRIMPDFVPRPEAAVFWTGVAEIVGALGLAQPVSAGLRRAAGVGLAAYAVCVFPANINHFVMDMTRPDNGWGLIYHIPRMIAQPVLVWLALWAGGVSDWPFRRRKSP